VNEPLRVALLGCGGVGARHAEAIRNLPGLMRLVAVCGRDASATTAFAARFRALPYTDYPRMLGEATPDLLIVALPPFAHDGQVEVAARAGINILVEKPIALDLDRAGHMVEAVQAGGIVGACGFMYRFGDAVRAWDEEAAAGRTGKAGHFAGQFHCNALHAPWWREREKSGGQIAEQLIHIIDLARHMLGEPQSVYARASNYFHQNVPGYTAEDMSAIVLGYDDGRIGALHASNAAVPGHWTKQWQIVAARMTGLFRDWNNAELFRTDREVTSRQVAGDRDVFVAQLENVAGAIREGHPPLVPLSEGVSSLRIALAAGLSADERREVLL
jgi:predicted dehydrogenase